MVGVMVIEIPDAIGVAFAVWAGDVRRTARKTAIAPIMGRKRFIMKKFSDKFDVLAEGKSSYLPHHGGIIPPIAPGDIFSPGMCDTLRGGGNFTLPVAARAGVGV